jgi:hypothetical protein
MSYKLDKETLLFLVTELTNTYSSYEVQYLGEFWFRLTVSIPDSFWVDDVLGIE